MNDAPQTAQSVPPAHPLRAAGAAPLRLMLVGDCRSNRMLVSAVLMRWGIVPIVAYTSLDLGRDSARWARVGLTAVLAKPCSAGSLQSCLLQWCPERFGVN